ncbi:hypothetical protein BRD17_09930 [Halobacteriales archaeon SW_7_68_16]|nr:MAG: hypothetical protein BRD17_09930 [Halobacteriales archaeon SW_7_68_16]
MLVGLHWLSPNFLQSVVQTVGFDARVTFQNIHVFAIPAVGAVAIVWYLGNGGPLSESLGRLGGWGLIAVGAGLVSGASWAINVGSIGLGNVLQGLGIAGVLDSDTIGFGQVIVSLSPEVLLTLGGILAGAYLSATYLLTS